MTYVKGKFIFHKAGQGCFYSGRIFAEPYRNFYSVYDCGSLSNRNSIRDEIKALSRKVAYHNNGIINLLVLSHLDADHVNEISNFIHLIKQCKIALLPYLNPYERLILAIKANPEEFEEDDYVLYLSFLQDPISFLLSRNVDQIILIDGGDESNDGNAIPNPPDPPVDNDEDLDCNTKNLIAKSSSELNDEQERWFRSGKVQICADKQSLYASVYWEFYFFNKKEGNFTAITNLKEHISSQLSKEIGDELDEDELKSLLNKDNIKSFRTKFKKEFKDLNSTGIILMHHPITIQCHSSLKSTILNGDVNLNTLLYPKYIIDTWYKYEPFHRTIFQVPHHGSINNWDINFFNKHKHYAIFYSQNFIINFGWGNTYGHPSEKVIKELNLHGYNLVNQFESFSYKIHGE